GALHRRSAGGRRAFHIRALRRARRRLRHRLEPDRLRAGDLPGKGGPSDVRRCDGEGLDHRGEEAGEVDRGSGSADQINELGIRQMNVFTAALFAALALAGAPGKGPLKPGDKAPEFRLRAIDGAMVRLDELAYPGKEKNYAKKKPIFIDFFRT